MTLDALETGLKFDDFSGLLSGIPDSETEPVGGNLIPPGSTVNSQIGSSTIQDMQYSIKHARIKGYENTRMQNEKAEDTGYRIEEIPRSLVAPLPRGRRIITVYSCFR